MLLSRTNTDLLPIKWTSLSGERQYSGQITPQIKNECLLVAKNCEKRSSAVLQRENDLRNEIAKGLDVYTSGELKIMQEQLKWIEIESANGFKVKNCKVC